MTELWREWLYPLGFLSTIAFSSRMLLQWLSSEAKGRSTVMPTFWILSLCGNTLLALHALIQIQFHVCLIQACNGIISWRNFDLMRPTAQQSTFKKTCISLFIAAACVVATFWLQGILLGTTASWFRIPATPWQDSSGIHISPFWHLLGFIGLVLFASRFWIQWWCAEKHGKSYLGGAFWWASLVGDLLCTAYFIAIGDPVNYLGPLFGLVVYTRNLMLIRKENATTIESS